MNNDPTTVNVREINMSDDALSAVLNREKDMIREALGKEEELALPQMQVYSDDTHVATIVLKAHIDEDSYRKAFLEVAITLPMFAVTATSLWFRTADERLGILHVSCTQGIGGSFLSADGQPSDVDEFNAQDIDTESVIVLDRFVNTPADASFVDEAIHTLTKRGHHVIVHSDLSKLFKTKI